MATLVFFDKDHEYQIDGDTVPSVSELTRFISREIYGTVSQYTLDAKAAIGTRVHKALESLDEYGKVEAADDILPYLQAYLLFRKEHTAEWQFIEKPFYHTELMYAGTIDRLGVVDGKLTLLDFKTSLNLHKPLLDAQLNLYRMMLETHGIKPEKLIVIQLKKDGTYKIQDIPAHDDIAMSCITLHNSLKKKERKKKNG